MLKLFCYVSFIFGHKIKNVKWCSRAQIVPDWQSADFFLYKETSIYNIFFESLILLYERSA